MGNMDMQRIRDAAAGRDVYLSTSQGAMVGIALCDPSYFYAGMTAAEAWRRIDADQLAAILAYHGKA